MYEHRRFSRVSVSLPCTLTSPEGEKVSAKVVDISMRGMLLLAPGKPATGTPYTIHLDLEPEKVVELKGTVVSGRGENFALEIDGIRADTFENWRELLLSATDDEVAMDHEITGRMDILPELY